MTKEEETKQSQEKEPDSQSEVHQSSVLDWAVSSIRSKWAKSEEISEKFPDETSVSNNQQKSIQSPGANPQIWYLIA